MRDPFVNYDQWLEAPYQHMMEESDRYYAFCEEEDIDPDDPDSQRAYEDYCAEVYDYEPDEDYDDWDDDIYWNEAYSE